MNTLKSKAYATYQCLPMTCQGNNSPELECPGMAREERVYLSLVKKLSADQLPKY